MRKFSINVRRNLTIWHNHYLSDKFIKEEWCYDNFKEKYPLRYWSRGFDKPAVKWGNGTCLWCLNNKEHRVGNPAWIDVNGNVVYYEF